MIGILHLSDFHFREGSPSPRRLAEHIAGAACSGEVDRLHLLVCITGDIAFSGKREEYAIAGEFFAVLKESLSQRGAAVSALIAVPGNHDCDFSERSGLDDEVLSSPEPISSSNISSLAEVQSSFRAFCAASDIRTLEAEGLRFESVEAEGCLFSFILVNSSLTSALHEKQATLRFCREHAGVVHDSHSGSSAGSIMSIALMHHPYSWFSAQDSKDLRSFIELRSDLVLTGHEHDGNVHRMSGERGISVGFVEGGALIDGAEPDASEFNLALLNRESKRWRVLRFRWDGSRYVEGSSFDWEPIWRNPRRTGGDIEFLQAHRDALEDLGIAIQHPRVDRPVLSAIYVYPDLREIPAPGTGMRSGERISNPVDFVMQRRRVLLKGQERAGKSAIARHLCLDLKARGLLPVFVRGGDFTLPKEENLTGIIRDRILKQYGAIHVEAVMQAKPAERAIVFDDFGAFRGGRELRAKMLWRLEAFFGVVVLVSSEDYRLEYLVSGAKDSRHSILEYAYAEILPLGSPRRHQLIAKWYWLGREEGQVEPAAGERDIRTAGSIVTSIIGKNLIPSYPIYILVLLQQLELGRQHDVVAGSYGHMYGALITASLARIARGVHVLDAWVSYLAAMAWQLHSAWGSVSVSKRDLKEWHVRYCDQEYFDLHFEDTIQGLAGALVIVEDGDSVRFRYPYYYYYFLASYIRSRIHEPDMQALVRDMMRSLHVERTATTVMFLAHLCSDPFIVSEMLARADSLLADGVEWRADMGNKFFGDVGFSFPELVEVSGRPEENYLEELNRADDDELDLEAGGENGLAMQDAGGDESDLDRVLEITSAIKTIQIIGQVLRSYPGSIHGPVKVRLTGSCYRLGMRLIGRGLQDIDANGKAYAEGLVRHLMRIRREVPMERLVAEVNAFLFSLCDMYCFWVLRHVSQSLGQEELARVHTKVMADSAGHKGFRMVDLAIRFDHFKSPPIDDAIRMYEEERSVYLTASVIRHLAWSYLYLFPASLAVRKRLCARLNIRDGGDLMGGAQKLLPRPR